MFEPRHQMQYQHGCRLRNNGGFSLIEVLVSMLILAVGLLGIASLQFKGLQYSTDASIRSNIVMLAYDIADRMRLNRDNANAYLLPNYVVPNVRPVTCVQASGANAVSDINCWQRGFWIDNNSSHVPPGTTVSIVAGGIANLYTVKFDWTDREGTGQSIDYAFIP